MVSVNGLRVNARAGDVRHTDGFSQGDAVRSDGIATAH